MLEALLLLTLALPPQAPFAGIDVGSVVERDAVFPINVSDMFRAGLLCDEFSNVVAHGFGRVVFGMAEVESPYGLSVDFDDVPAAAGIATIAGVENKNTRHAQILARNSRLKDVVGSLGVVGNPFEVPVGMRLLLPHSSPAFLPPDDGSGAAMRASRLDRPALFGNSDNELVFTDGHPQEDIGFPLGFKLRGGFRRAEQCVSDCDPLPHVPDYTTASLEVPVGMSGEGQSAEDRRVPAPRFTPHSGVTSRPWLLSVVQFPERVFPSGNLWSLHAASAVDESSMTPLSLQPFLPELERERPQADPFTLGLQFDGIHQRGRNTVNLAPYPPLGLGRELAGIAALTAPRDQCNSLSRRSCRIQTLSLLVGRRVRLESHRHRCQSIRLALGRLPIVGLRSQETTLLQPCGASGHQLSDSDTSASLYLQHSVYHNTGIAVNYTGIQSDAAVSSLGLVGNPFEVPVGMRGEGQMAGTTELLRIGFLQHLSAFPNRRPGMATFVSGMHPAGAVSHIVRKPFGIVPAALDTQATFVSDDVFRSVPPAHNSQCTLHHSPAVMTTPSAATVGIHKERQTAGIEPATQANHLLHDPDSTRFTPPSVVITDCSSPATTRPRFRTWLGEINCRAIPHAAVPLRVTVHAASAADESSTQEEQGKPDYVLRTGAVFLSALTVAEIEVTRAVLERGGEERNPIYKPFEDHPGVLGLVNGAVTGGLGLVALELDRRGKKTAARLFLWTMVAAKAVVFTHNVRQLHQTGRNR